MIGEGGGSVGTNGLHRRDKTTKPVTNTHTEKCREGHIYRPTYRLTDRETHRPTVSETDRQTDRQANRQTDRQKCMK